MAGTVETAAKIYNVTYTKVGGPWEIMDTVTIEIDDNCTVEVDIPEGTIEESEIRVMF